jgi:hypothetical protein
MITAKAGQTRVNDLFFPLALVYLVIPNLIFLATWVRPWIGIPAAIMVVICLVFLVWQNRPGEPRQGLGRINLVFVLALAFYWTLLAGAGGFVPQETDYIKHNLVFHDLVHFAWPVTYSLPDGGKSYLCYGLGYYLAPALGGRILGDAAMPVLTFLWMFAGVALFFYWVATFARTPKTTLLIFLLFAATNAGLLALKRIGVPGLMDAVQVRATLLQLGLYHSYYDFFTKLQFQPQHGLGALVGMALFYEMLWINKDPRGAVFIWGACLFWSPLPCVGLLLVPLAALRRVPWRAYFSLVNLVGGGILLAVMGIYFQGHVALAERGFVWNLSSGGEWLVFYLLFVVFELSPVLLLFLIDQRYRVLGEFRPLFLLATGFLLLLPLWKIGHSGDLRLQAGTPVLVVAALGATRCLQSGVFSLKRPLFILFTGCLLVGAVYPIGRPWRNLIINKEDYSYACTVQTRGFRTLAEYKEPHWDLAAQYLGRSDSAAARWLLR